MADKKDMLIKVVKLPLSELLPEYQSVSKFQNAVVVYPNGQKKPGKIVNFCSDDYTLIENKEILDRIEEGLKTEFDIDISYRHRNFAKFYIDYTIKDKTAKVEKGDFVGLRMRVQNSYDGRIKFGYNFGLMRLVCTNGAVAPDPKYNKNFSSMHTPQIITNNLIDTMIDTASDFLGELPKIIGPYKEMAKKKVPKNIEAITKRMMDIAEDTKYPIRQIPNAVDIALNEAEQLKLEMSDWVIYQAMNNILNHSNEIKMEWHKREEVDRQIIIKFIE